MYAIVVFYKELKKTLLFAQELKKPAGHFSQKKIQGKNGQPAFCF